MAILLQIRRICDCKGEIPCPGSQVKAFTLMANPPALSFLSQIMKSQHCYQAPWSLGSEVYGLPRRQYRSSEAYWVRLERTEKTQISQCGLKDTS